MVKVFKLRILTLADIHGNIKALRKLLDHLIDKDEKIDLIIISGDMPLTTPIRFMLRFILTHTSLSKEKYTEWVYKGKGHKAFVEMQKKSIVKILDLLKIIKAPIVYVPGNVDTFESQELLKKWNESEIHFLDLKEIKLKSLRIFGVGGSLHSPERSKIPLCDMEFSNYDFEERVESAMEIYETKTPKVDIIVTHEAPAFSYNTISSKRNGGSSKLTEIITKMKPKLVIFGHFHEFPLLTKDRNDVIYINPGPLANYKYAIIDLDEKIIKPSLRRLSTPRFDPIRIIYSNRTNLKHIEENFRLGE